MNIDLNHLKRCIEDVARLIKQGTELDPQCYAPFLQRPELALGLVDLIEDLDEEDTEDERNYYSACVFALDICVAQLQPAQENGNKSAHRTLTQLMARLAQAINQGQHTLSFWLPVLNAFYEMHVELSSELKNAYFELASRDDEGSPDEEVNHLNAIRDMIDDLSDLSIFDIAENFFAQSYAMPADFFSDLIIDLYSIDEGQDIALLTLLHPKQEVREVVVATLDQIMSQIRLTSLSLSRLRRIKNWYPSHYHARFDRWLKIQRKQGVIFSCESPLPVATIKASEIDGGGAQGVFIHVKNNKKNRLCGLLFKQSLGIKDAWITPEIPTQEVARYYGEAFDDSITLREVSMSYLTLMMEHFLAVTIDQGGMPNLHLLEIQELLGIYLHPTSIEVTYVLQQLGAQIVPFTITEMQQSFKRSKIWPKNKRFTESWFIENAHIDKLVNRCCSFIDGVKVCALEEAVEIVFREEFEAHREKWLFHFLWTALWAKSKARKNEKIWQDSFFIAYAIEADYALATIPIMQEICHQSVINSIETMQDRRTHLNTE